jgi:hypothetical protein
MNSDEDKIYRKRIVAFDEIYNFVVQTFSFEVIFGVKNRYTIHISVYGIQIWIIYQFFES